MNNLFNGAASFNRNLGWYQRLSAAVEALRGSCCLRDECPELS